MLKKFNLKSVDKRIKYILILVAMVIPIAGIFIGVELSQRYESIRSEAGVNQANIFIQPSQSNVTGQTAFQLWVTVGNPVGFVSTEINFDKNSLKLLNEVNTTTSILKKDILVTTMANANSTGKITVVLGLDPANIANPASGTFMLANLNFGPNTQNQNVSTVLVVNNTNTQVVGMDTSNFTIASANSSLIVNSTAVNKPGDVNGDGVVNIVDIGLIIDNYDKNPSLSNQKADLNHDGAINIIDIGIVVDNYGK